MSGRVRHVTSCPLCGGILQSTSPEPLTSAEIDAAPPGAAPPRQCLLCGYLEAAAAERQPIAAR
jgi:hypothetical protein